MEIKKTKDYSKFNFLKFNREIDVKHVERLMRTMEKDNLMDVLPVVIDKDWNVIEGQHRIKAAEALNEWIYYIQTNRIFNQEKIADFNTIHRKWDRCDYAISYGKAHFDDPDFHLLLKDPIYRPLISACAKIKKKKERSIQSKVVSFSQESIYILIKKYSDLWKFIYTVAPNYWWKHMRYALSLIRLGENSNFDECIFRGQFLRFASQFPQVLTEFEATMQFLEIYNMNLEPSKKIQYHNNI